MSKLYFYYSAMNAGKSTTLLQSGYNYIERGMQVLLFAPSIDHRFEKAAIHSRIGLTQEANGFDKETHFFHLVQEQKNSLLKLACILVDEAHFLTKEQVKQLTQITTQLRLPVLCYGLRSDFQGEPFEGSMYLLLLADNLIELKTICYCGRKAIMNARMDAQGCIVRSGEQVEIGGNDKYVAMCRKHFKEGWRNNDDGRSAAMSQWALDSV